MKEILLATNNKGKVERYKMLAKEAGLSVTFHTPDSLGVEPEDVVEDGKTLEANALKKALAYYGHVEYPILANDTGFYVEGEGFVDAPKRIALGDRDEKDLTPEEKKDALLSFWKGIAQKYGGEVDAYWQDVFVLVDTLGETYSAEGKREVVLADTEFAEPHIDLPMRALYKSKTTGKPALLHTKEEELQELEPVTNALKEVLSNV